MSTKPPTPEISRQRKAVYYVGIGLVLVGAILFLSTFVSFAMNFGNFDNFAGNAQSIFLRAVIGMVLLIAGGIVMRAGWGGLAGSGLLLDPERARRELEPMARLSGGLTDTAFSEMKTVRETLENMGNGGAPREVVKVRCRQCQHLNDESNKFCGHCGEAL
jgi:hypothetical protein